MMSQVCLSGAVTNHSTPAICTRRSVGSGKLVVKSIGDVVGHKLYISANRTVLL